MTLVAFATSSFKSRDRDKNVSFIILPLNLSYVKERIKRHKPIIVLFCKKAPPLCAMYNSVKEARREARRVWRFL